LEQYILNRMNTVNPLIREFILFCAERQTQGWPALYDEMCRVAGQRLFQGLGYSDLRSLGLSFSLNRMENTIRTVETVITHR
jgi:hypothetical protein